jgi:hypothetical protein
MPRSTRGSFKMDIRPVVEHIGLNEAIRQIGMDAVIDQVGLDAMIRKFGEKEVLRRIGVDRLLNHLTEAEKRELKQRLQQEPRTK